MSNPQGIYSTKSSTLPEGSVKRVLPAEIEAAEIANLSSMCWPSPQLAIIGRDECYTRDIHHCYAQLGQEVRERNLLGNFEGLQLL